MNDEHKRICGAMNRQGKPCQVSPMKGKSRCRLHGGKTPKARHTGPLKHGLYSKALSPDERAVWDDISLDSLDEEIKMTRIWLARAGVLDYEISQDSNSTAALTGFDLVEIRRSSDGSSVNTDAISKRPDLWARKDRLLGRLAQLVKTRIEMEALKVAQGDPTARFVVEIVPEDSPADWMANYGHALPDEDPDAP